MDRGDPFAGLRETSEEYKVYDSHYEKIGKVDDLLIDQDERVAYVGVKMGFFGTNSTVVPVEILRINDKRRLIEVAEPAETIKHAPHFGKSEELTPELENHVRTYFGLEPLRPSPEHQPRDLYPPVSTSDEQVDLVPGERASQQRSVPDSGSGPQERPAEPQPERVEEQESISERLSDEPKSPWEWLTGGGVTVHRLRR